MTPDLFTDFRADGQTYSHDKDQSRLAAQMSRVWEVVKNGQWFSLAEIAAKTGDPESSVSARLRDLRKDRFGGHVVDRRRRGPGTFEYAVTGQKKKAAA